MAAHLRGLRVRVPLGGMDVCWESCVLSCRGLCDRPIPRLEESYRLWCVILEHEAALARVGLLLQKQQNIEKYKVVQIWPGQTVTCLHINSPGHIWTTLYNFRAGMFWLRAGRSGLRFLGRVKRSFCSPKRPDRLWDPRWLLSMGKAALSLGIKRPGRESGHSPPCSAWVKNKCRSTSASPICLHGVHRDRFTFVLWFDLLFFMDLKLCLLR